MKILLIVCLLTFTAVAIPAQEKKSESKAAIYVYAYTASATIGTVKKTVYLDGKAIADISPERYFIAMVDAGNHSLHFENKKYGGIEKDFKAGTIYYLRVDWQVGMSVKPAGLTIVPPENGAFDVKQLKAIDKGRIKNADIVILEMN